MEYLTDKINRFLAISSGSGYGDGSGDGSGYGYGYGSSSGDGSGYGYGYGSSSGDGSGSGYGSGSGDGSGDGYGSGSSSGSSYGSGDGSSSGDGDGDGLKSFDGRPVYYIDNIPTIIYNIIGNNARGAVVSNDLTLIPCYIAKVGNFFAHGTNLHAAQSAALIKYNRNKPLDERIHDFVIDNPSLDSVCTNRYLFDQHNILTGSCELGRKLFCQEHDIDLDGSMTVRQFINITINSYGGDAIKKLFENYAELIKIENNELER